MHHGQSTDGQYHAFWNVHFHGKSAGGSGNSGGAWSLNPNALCAGDSNPLGTGSPTVLVGGKPAVNNTCKCMCNWGGVIQIVNPGPATTTMVP